MEGSPRGRTTRRHIGQSVGRLELHNARPLHPRSAGCGWSDLRIWLTFCDHRCPLLSVVRRSAADPARTEGDPSLGAILHVTKITPDRCQQAWAATAGRRSVAGRELIEGR